MASYEIGERVGDYEITGILGEGGMGKVYKVRNVISDRIEALKVLHPQIGDHPEAMARFMREIRLQAGLDHPNIASLRTALTHQNQLLMVMEYVEGNTLAGLLKSRGGPIPPAEAIEYMLHTLDALGYAHARGIVHRDVKPANIIVTPAGQAKLMDFGVAKLVEDHQLTATGATLGSLFYMSPEQIRGETIDGRSDLYSLGITLYELVTGRRPFDADTQFSIMRAHLEQEPSAPIVLDPTLPSALNEIILLSLRKPAGERFQSAEAFRSALQSLRSPQAAAAAALPTAPLDQRSRPPAPAGSPAVASGNRALYLVLGSVVTVAVLVLAAFQLPKWFGTSAGTPNSPAQTTEQSTPAPVEPASLPSAGQPSEETSSAQPQTSSPDAGQPPSQSPSSSSGQSSSALPTPARRSSTPASAGTQAQPPAGRTATDATRATETAVAPAQVQSTPAQAPPQNSAERDRITTARTDLAIRANTVVRGLEDLERQQRAQGLSLRSDMVATRMRMETLLDQADRAVNAGRLAEADQALKDAELAVRRLERFLGQ